MVTTASPELQRQLARQRSHGMTRDPDAFVNTELAVDPAQAGRIPGATRCRSSASTTACPTSSARSAYRQLSKLDRFKAARAGRWRRATTRRWRRWPRCCGRSPGPGCDPVLHLYERADRLRRVGLTRAPGDARACSAGIGTQVHYIPVHRQPYYASATADADLPGADAWYARCLSLPLFPAMEDGDVERVVEALREVIG